MIRTLLFKNKNIFKPRLTTKIALASSILYYIYTDNNVIKLYNNQLFDEQHDDIYNIIFNPVQLTNNNQISVIIPTYNEQKVIENTLKTAINNQYNNDNNTRATKVVDKMQQPYETLKTILHEQFNNDNNNNNIAIKQQQPIIQYILADGGSTDNTIHIAKSIKPDIHIYQSNKRLTRAATLNNAIRKYTNNNDILLICHSDTLLPYNWPTTIQHSLNIYNTIAGCFEFNINNSSEIPLSDWLIYNTNIRARYLHLPYGDQTLYLRRSTFDLLHGYKSYYRVMEDIDIIQRLRKYGNIAVANDYIITDNRRYKTLGVVTNTIINQLCVICYILNIPNKWIYKLYKYTYNIAEAVSNK